MVRVNNFEVQITSNNPVKEFQRNAGYYVALKSGSEYQLILTNNRPTICDVDLFIDGKEVGTWRINEYSSIILERPLAAQRKFTFFAENSREARDAGIIKNINSGLITAIFKPKKTYTIPKPEVINDISASSVLPNETPQRLSTTSRSLKSGVTLLGDDSNQKFVPVTPIDPKDIDYNNITTIMIRMVVESDYVQIPSLYPVPNKTTLYPPRIDDVPIEPPNDLYFGPILTK